MGYKTGKLVYVLTYESEKYSREIEVFDTLGYALFRAKCLFDLDKEEHKFLMAWHILPLCDEPNTVIELEAMRISEDIFYK